MAMMRESLNCYRDSEIATLIPMYSESDSFGQGATAATVTAGGKLQTIGLAPRYAVSQAATTSRIEQATVAIAINSNLPMTSAILRRSKCL